MKLTCIRNLVVIVSLLLLAGALSVQAVGTTFTTTTTASGNWSTTANWTTTAPTGNQIGNIALNGAASITLTLDQATTIGEVTTYSGGSVFPFTINASGTVAMMFDNTGATVNNIAGDKNSCLGMNGHSSITFNPNIIIANTDMDI